ncbi:patatin-like phospholipase family protein [Dietzia aurantiaca]|uniref:Patatin-like phospholipase family protein n=1 Tax=Dietzia aurantiaca TaxID=983873 RepID=A0ABV9PUV1_9ACTN
MRIALALGSGGARGYAHIGVIRELEARGHEVVGVSGASMGAVVGSLYAAGKLDAFEEWVRGLSQRDVLRLLDPSFAGGGAIRANKIMAVIGSMLDGIRIEGMSLPFTAVATDLKARREIWFTQGPADVAVRASFAIPSVITPALVGGRLVIDGGVTNPVPLEPLAPVESDMLLAVSLTGRRTGMRVTSVFKNPGPEDGDDADTGHTRKGPGAARSAGTLTGRIRTAAADVRDAELVRSIAARWGQGAAEGGDLRDDTTAGPDGRDGPGTLTDAAASASDAVTASATTDAEPSHEVEESVARGEAEVESEDPGDASLPGTLRIFDVVIHSIEVMESIITAYRMAANRPDVLVEVPSDSCTAFDFHRADEMIALGRRLTAEALDRAGF